MEQAYEHGLIIDKINGDKRVTIPSIRNCLICDAYGRVDFKLILANLLRPPGLFSECSNFEISIVVVGHSKKITLAVLYDFLHFDIAVRLPSKLLLERQVSCLKVVLDYIVVLLRLLSD